jgi:hypothetical protein
MRKRRIEYVHRSSGARNSGSNLRYICGEPCSQNAILRLDSDMDKHRCDKSRRNRFLFSRPHGIDNEAMVSVPASP